VHHLHYVVAFTGNFDAMRRFYERSLELRVRRAEPDWVEFDTVGASFALHRMDDPGRQGQMLRFVTDDLDASLAELAARGLERDGDVIEFRGSRMAGFFDADGNHLQLIQPAHAAPSGAGPRIERVILHVRDVARATAFYHQRMGIPVLNASAETAELDSGATRLTLRSLAIDNGELRCGTQAVVLGFDVPSIEELGRELAGRGLVFTGGPSELEFGRSAEVTDPDGRRVLFRSNDSFISPVVSLDYADYGNEDEWDDESPTRDAMRKPVVKGAKATSRVAVKPVYRAKKKAKPRAKVTARPKNTPANTRAVKPATGRLKKAERRSAARKKAALARSSRSKPVKRAVAKQSRPARPRARRTRGR
jgi:catechol 2,3-dioxygenase-like lactoylglutathione lyase family enzyme